MPMVFTSTSGGPTSAAIRSMTFRVAPEPGQRGGGRFLRRRAAELTARADHDRYMLAHTLLLPVVFSFTAGMVRSRHRIPVIYHLGGQLRRLAPGLSSCPAAGCRAPTGQSGPGRA